MDFEYYGHMYRLVEFVEPKSGAHHDIIGVFKVVYKNKDLDEEIQFINYFYGASVESIDSMIKIAKEYIDIQK